MPLKDPAYYRKHRSGKAKYDESLVKDDFM